MLSTLTNQFKNKNCTVVCKIISFCPSAVFILEKEYNKKMTFVYSAKKKDVSLRGFSNLADFICFFYYFRKIWRGIFTNWGFLMEQMENFKAVRSLESTEKSRFLGKTYGWMALALLASAVSAFVAANAIFTENNGRLALSAFGAFMFGGARIGMWVCLIGEIALVWWLSASISKISVQTAKIAFFAYAILNGITLSTILLAYTMGSIASTFIGAAAMFGVMSFYGARTQKDLSTTGRYLGMALIGLIIANAIQIVVSMISGTPMRFFDFLISIAGVAIFTGLTAFDTQKLIKIANSANDSDDYAKVSIIAALNLYLDFINIFLYLMRLFGKRR